LASELQHPGTKSGGKPLTERQRKAAIRRLKKDQEQKALLAGIANVNDTPTSKKKVPKEKLEQEKGAERKESLEGQKGWGYYCPACCGQ
jgi:hypothetical protein